MREKRREVFAKREVKKPSDDKCMQWSIWNDGYGCHVCQQKTNKIQKQNKRRPNKLLHAYTWNY